jgi:5-(carboxyamino)imidazole ribonucleotide mutase
LRKVAIIMGSDSDMPLSRKAIDQLTLLRIPHEAHILSAHRTPVEALDFARMARSHGFGVIIAIAGKAAHLGGILASMTTLPVIAVPVKGADLGGMDALLSSVQMPTGVPVATVAIDGAANAAILAAEILSVEDESLATALQTAKDEMKDTVLSKDKALQEGKS